MQIHNFIPVLIDCLKQWKNPPRENEFLIYYERILEPWLKPMLEDFKSYRDFSFFDCIRDVNWEQYRKKALTIDPQFEEARVKRCLSDVEGLLGQTLEGQVIVFGSFESIDGYARFHKGKHTVYFGVDENPGPSKYLDVLAVHELTHVAREGQASVWQGFGLSPTLTHDEFVEHLPLIEHLVNEGFSCLTSELLVPGLMPHEYTYQTTETYHYIMNHKDILNTTIHACLKDPAKRYVELYQPATYQAYNREYTGEFPLFAQYVWGWLFTKHLLHTFAGGDIKRLLKTSSKELVDAALQFKI